MHHRSIWDQRAGVWQKGKCVSPSGLPSFSSALGFFSRCGEVPRAEKQEHGSLQSITCDHVRKLSDAGTVTIRRGHMGGLLRGRHTGKDGEGWRMERERERERERETGLEKCFEEQWLLGDCCQGDDESWSPLASQMSYIYVDFQKEELLACSAIKTMTRWTLQTDRPGSYMIRLAGQNVTHGGFYRP